MSTMKETLLDIEGMTCGACVRHVTAALAKVEGVEAVDVSLEKNQARVRHGESAPSIERMTAAVADAGYAARVASADAGAARKATGGRSCCS